MKYLIRNTLLAACVSGLAGLAGTAQAAAPTEVALSLVGNYQLQDQNADASGYLEALFHIGPSLISAVSINPAPGFIADPIIGNTIDFSGAPTPWTLRELGPNSIATLVPGGFGCPAGAPCGPIDLLSTTNATGPTIAGTTNYVALGAKVNVDSAQSMSVSTFPVLTDLINVVYGAVPAGGQVMPLLRARGENFADMTFTYQWSSVIDPSPIGAKLQGTPPAFAISSYSISMSIPLKQPEGALLCQDKAFADASIQTGDTTNTTIKFNTNNPNPVDPANPDLDLADDVVNIQIIDEMDDCLEVVGNALTGASCTNPLSDCQLTDFPEAVALIPGNKRRLTINYTGTGIKPNDTVTLTYTTRNQCVAPFIATNKVTTLTGAGKESGTVVSDATPAPPCEDTLGTLGAPSLRCVSKTFNPTFINAANGQVDATVIVQNNGNIPINDVVITDTMDPKLTYVNNSSNIGNLVGGPPAYTLQPPQALNPGQFLQLTFKVDVTNLSEGEAACNQASVSSISQGLADDGPQCRACVSRPGGGTGASAITPAGLLASLALLPLAGFFFQRRRRK